MKNLVLAAMLLSLLGACSSKNSETTREMTNEDKVKMEQYMVQGEALFSQYCSACHQADGNGLADLYPPLNNSDYLQEHYAEMPCIIKNGIQGEITVNGKTYNQLMPGLNMLTDLQIAEIVTYVGNSWENDLGFKSVTDVASALEACN